MSNKFLNLILLLSITGSAFCGKGSSIQGSSIQGSNRLGSGLGATADTTVSQNVRSDNPRAQVTLYEHHETELAALTSSQSQQAFPTITTEQQSRLSFDDLLKYMPNPQRPNYGPVRLLGGLIVQAAKSIGAVSPDTSDSLEIQEVLDRIDKKTIKNDRETASQIQSALNRCLTHKGNPENELQYANLALIILNAGTECDVNCATTKAVKEWLIQVFGTEADARQLELATQLEQAKSHLTNQREFAGRSLLALYIAEKLRCDDKESSEALKTKMADIARRMGILDLIISDLSRDKKQEDTQSSLKLTDAQQAGTSSKPDTKDDAQQAEPSHPQQATFSNVSSPISPASATVPVVDPSMSGVS